MPALAKTISSLPNAPSPLPIAWVEAPVVPHVGDDANRSPAECADLIDGRVEVVLGRQVAGNRIELSAKVENYDARSRRQPHGVTASLPSSSRGQQ